MAKKKKIEKAEGDAIAASSAAGWALFKEEVPKPMNISGVAGKKSVETGVAQDDTLMGRLAKRMVSRDYIAKQNLGLGREAPKANTADAQEDIDELAKTDRDAALNALIEKDAKRHASKKHKEMLGMTEEAEGDVAKAPLVAIADDAIPKRMNISGIAKGIEVEKEHTKDPKKAEKIAKDHLKESKNYYKDWDKKEKLLFKPEVANQGPVILGTPDPMPQKPAKGKNMAEQAKSSGNVFGKPQE